MISSARIEVGEDRPLAGAELPFARIVDQRADQVGRQQVGRELDAVELAMDRGRQRLDGRGLGQPGDALEQDVPAGQQRDQEPRKHLVLPDQDLADLGLDPFELVRVLENLILDLLDVDGHIFCSTLPWFSSDARNRPLCSGEPGAGVRETSRALASPEKTIEETGRPLLRKYRVHGSLRCQKISSPVPVRRPVEGTVRWHRGAVFLLAG